MGNVKLWITNGSEKGDDRRLYDMIREKSQKDMI